MARRRRRRHRAHARERARCARARDAGGGRGRARRDAPAASLGALRGGGGSRPRRLPRRDRWLSYYAHEMRNALNTLVNAHWILKNSEGKQTTKVLEMAERAVRRLEAAVKEVRDLESHALKPAPGRPDKE